MTAKDVEIRRARGGSLSAPRIAFAGGGSAGHITPNLALIEEARARGFEVLYFGTSSGMEADLVRREGIPFFSVPSERLRRHLDWRNCIAPFIVSAGILFATWRLARQRPALLFSKGGFAALPVVLGAWLNRIPVFIHESDRSAGLANRLSAPFAKALFASTPLRAGSKQARVVGPLLRRAFRNPDPAAARVRHSLSSERSILLVIGGSQGAMSINQALWGALPTLTERYQVVHICGPGKRDLSADESPHYLQLEYLSEGFADLCAAAELVVSRAGANSIAELRLLQRPALLIPLPATSSRGDQEANAERFVAAGFGAQLLDRELSAARLIEAIAALEGAREQHRAALAAGESVDGVAELMNYFEKHLQSY